MINIAVFGARETRKHFEERIAAVPGALHDVGLEALKDARTDFAQKAYQHLWPPLGDITVILRHPVVIKIGSLMDIGRKRDAIPILVETGKLFNSLTPGHPNNILMVEALSVTYGTNVAYAAKHQLGQGGGKLDTSPQWLNQVLDMKSEFGRKMFHILLKGVKINNVVKRKFLNVPNSQDRMRYGEILAHEIVHAGGK